jgi:hypothetical protein
MHKHIIDAFAGVTGMIITISDISEICSLIVTLLVIAYYTLRFITYKSDRKRKRNAEDLETQIKQAELDELRTKHSK